MIKLLFKIPDSSLVLRLAAKGLNDFDGRTELIQRRHLALQLLDVSDAFVSIFVEQEFQHLTGGAAVFGKVVALFDLVGSFASGKWLPEGNVADQIEWIDILAGFLG